MPFHWVISSWISTNKLFATELQYVLIIWVNSTTLRAGFFQLQRAPPKCIGGSSQRISWRKPIAANTVLPNPANHWNWSSSQLQLSWGLRTNMTKGIQTWQLQSFFMFSSDTAVSVFVPFIFFFWTGELYLLNQVCQCVNMAFVDLPLTDDSLLGMLWMLNWF